jgi:hypothetical protein
MSNSPRSKLHYKKNKNHPSINPVPSKALKPNNPPKDAKSSPKRKKSPINSQQPIVSESTKANNPKSQLSTSPSTKTQPFWTHSHEKSPKK